MSSPGFQFKQFYVAHDACAMKVGTDGVLLGAWCPASGAQRILDIGTGSGLIALMMAQRCPNAEIDAIDMDADAARQAEINFSASPWSERLNAHLSSLQAWSSKSPYDLIISNPPYFQNSLKNPNKGRELARHTDTLSFDELFEHSLRLLAQNGRICIILPAETETEICRLAALHGLHLIQKLYIHSKPGKPAKRIIYHYTNSPLLASHDSEAGSGDSALYLESESSPRSQEYAALCQDFYL